MATEDGSLRYLASAGGGGYFSKDKQDVCKAAQKRDSRGQMPPTPVAFTETRHNRTRDIFSSINSINKSLFQSFGIFKKIVIIQFLHLKKPNQKTLKCKTHFHPGGNHMLA